MAEGFIKELFHGDIYRPIEEVIKVDQTDEQVISDEIDEYVVTDAIKQHYARILRRYWETPNKPHEGIAVWVSGFFGSGKSSFAKMLGLALENRSILGGSAAEVFGQRTGDNELKVLLRQISEHIPTDSVIFDVSTDRGIKSGNQTLTEIMYRLFLKSLGYADDLDLAELEIALEQKNELERFKQIYLELFDQTWDENKDLIALAIGEASQVMNRLFPERYPSGDSWQQGFQDRADITPGKLAERCEQLMERRRPNRNLVFVIDEVGQFVARDVQKMLDLQAVVQSLGRVGRGKIWIVVTSQEKLTELVGGLDNKRVELARLMDRFPLQVHLEPSDISEVTSKRVLSKSAQAGEQLRALYTAQSGRLTAHTTLSADIQLPNLSAERFIDLYPLLPYHIDFIIQVVSGLRTQSGASKHVGGANRTIIKLAQQLLIHDAVGLAEKPIGALARVDQIYDLIAGNIASDIRSKISAITKEVKHPMAPGVAKAICLLQYVKSIHRTAENIAAALHPAVDADSLLPDVKEALRQLVDAQKVRLTDGQYRIPTPAEDDWETTRRKFEPKLGEINRIHAEMVTSLWEPKPTYTFCDVKAFKGGLVVDGRVIVDADIPFHVTLAGEDTYSQQEGEARSRSQSESKGVFWVVAISDGIMRETVEVFRSKEILSRKQRNAKTKVETSLVSEEKIRLRGHEGELRRLVKEAMLAGVIYFRGNDRSPDETITSVGQAATRVLGQVLPDVYNRFHEGAARVSSKDLAALMTDENLRGLPPVFLQLGLIRDQNGHPVINTELGPLKEIMGRIDTRTSYGETANGRYLADEFAKEPFGWDLDVVRLFIVTLLRAGLIKATSKGSMIESALSVDARNAFTANNLFKACSFQKNVSGTEIGDWIEADEAFQCVFGKQLPEMQASSVANAIRSEVSAVIPELHGILNCVLSHHLPGQSILGEVLDLVHSIRAGSDDDAILNFNGSHKALRDGIKYAADLAKALTDPSLFDLKRARKALDTTWPTLQSEPDLPAELEERAQELSHLMASSNFYRELATIEQYTSAIEKEYNQRFLAAASERAQTYQQAIVELKSQNAWSELNEEQKAIIVGPLECRATPEVPSSTTIPLLRSEQSACPHHFKSAVQAMHELIDGEKLATLKISDFFSDRVETPEQLEASLERLKQECLKLIGANKKVLIQ